MQFYAAGGHLLDVNDLVEKMRREPKGIFESSMAAVLFKGRAMGVPLAVNPWPVHARLDLAREGQGRVSEDLGRVHRDQQEDPGAAPAVRLRHVPGAGSDTTDNVMNLLWCYGGKMVQADNKTVVMNSPGERGRREGDRGHVQDAQDHPARRHLLGQFGQQQGLPVQAGRVRDEPVEHLRLPRRQRQGSQKVTGLFPVPAGPKGTVNQIDTWATALQEEPVSRAAKGLLDYFMQPANYDKIVQSTGGRWVPVYKRLFDSPFWKEKPAFKHFIQMAETGVPVSYAGSPTPAAGRC